mgnify:CR=1 FL=1|jgi:hypothetical protein
MSTLSKVLTSFNTNGIVILAKAPDSRKEFIVWFRANDRCTKHQSVAYRVRNWKAAVRKFDYLADKTEH